MTLRVLFPFACNNEHSSHLPFSLVRHLSSTDLRAELWVTRRGPMARANFVRAVFPGKLQSLVNRMNTVVQPKNNWPRKVVEHFYLRSFRKGDVALLSRGCSLELLRALRARGHVIFLERVNAMDHMAKRILEDAFVRAGWPVEHSYTQEMLDGEQAQVDIANFVFSANPLVTESLLERGIAEEKILECSYGWDAERFTRPERALPEINGVTVLFVGSVGMRKGAHLLLKAWSKAGIEGRLVLLGHMEPLIARHCTEFLQRRDVVHLPYNADPGPLYNSADIFAFPTLEEGGPLVSYEAMGNGLAIVTSPVGAGRIVRHRQEGLVVDPHDEHGWIEALRCLAQDAGMRRALGGGGRIRAADYTWDRVAQHRHELIANALSMPVIPG